MNPVCTEARVQMAEMLSMHGSHYCQLDFALTHGLDGQAKQ